MYKYSIVFFILSISFFILTYFITKRDYADLNESDCQNQSKWTKDECNVWLDNQCRKGKLSADGTSCMSGGDVYPLIGLILGLVSLITSIILFFYYKI